MPKLAEDPVVGRSTAQQRLRGLLEANRLVVEHLELPTVLRQIVVAAVDLVGAAYGAVGILGPDGKLDQFIHVGMDVETVARIGTPPVGLGLLGALIADPTVVRLALLDDDSRSVKTPQHHPPINSFLGVPLKVRDEVFGHLYLADPRVGAFSDDDQELVEALAMTAGVAISHARLFEESTRRQRWTAASTQITHELLTNDDVDAMRLISQRVLELAEADLVAVILGDGVGDYETRELSVHRAAGFFGTEVENVTLPHGDTLVRRCLATGKPQMLEDLGASTSTNVLPGVALGPAMAVALHGELGVRGSLLVLRDQGAPRFREFDLNVAASFAGQATLALERSDARIARGHIRTLEDRDRIARDLHDHVVQRLFAVGLHLQTLCAVIGSGAPADRLNGQIDEIDATIRQIRTTIFGLHTRPDGAHALRAQVLEAISLARVTLPCKPDVEFCGPVDLLVPSCLCGDVVAVVRETLTNVGRHARAQRVQVRVSADVAAVTVEVLDDGKGVEAGAPLSGLDNLRKRAVALDGSFEVVARAGPGTRVTWSVPLGNVGR